MVNIQNHILVQDILFYILYFKYIRGCNNVYILIPYFYYNHIIISNNIIFRKAHGNALAFRDGKDVSNGSYL